MLRRQPPELIDQLTLRKRLMSGVVTPARRAALRSARGDVEPGGAEDIQIELNHLLRLGFIEEIIGTNQCYHLRDMAAMEVARELRHANLI